VRIFFLENLNVFDKIINCPTQSNTRVSQFRIIVQVIYTNLTQSTEMFDSLSNLSHSGVERSDSMSTVSSSVAAADIRRQIENLKSSMPIKPTIHPTNEANMKFENVESLNIVYHTNFCNHTSKNGNWNKSQLTIKMWFHFEKL